MASGVVKPLLDCWHGHSLLYASSALCIAAIRLCAYFVLSSTSTAVHLQAVTGFGQIAAQKKQFGLLPVLQPPAASVPPECAQQQQQQQSLPSAASCKTAPSQQEGQTPAVVPHQQQAEPDRHRYESPCAATAACSESATNLNSTFRSGLGDGGAQAVLQSAAADSPQHDAGALDTELVPIPQQVLVPGEANNSTASCNQQESAAAQGVPLLRDSRTAGHHAASSRERDMTKAPQVRNQLPPNSPRESNRTECPQVRDQLPPSVPTHASDAAVAKATTASGGKQAVQGQNCEQLPRQKRPTAAAQQAGRPAVKRAKPTATRAASWALPKTGPRGHSGKSTKPSDHGNENAAGKACATGKACSAGKAYSAGKAGPGLLSPPDQPKAMLETAMPQPVTRHSLRVRKSAPVIVDGTSAEEEGSSSDYTDDVSANDCEPADHSLRAGGSKAAHRSAGTRQQLATDNSTDPSGTSALKGQTHCQESKDEDGQHEPQSLLHCSDTDIDSDVDNVIDSPEQPASKAGKRKRATPRGGVQKLAGAQRAKRDLAGLESSHQAGASRGGRGGRGSRRGATRQNFVRCNLKASF